MDTTRETAAALHPSLLLGAFAAELLHGKRVAIWGDVTTGFAEHVAALSGRKVHAYDSDEVHVSASIAKARGTRRTVRFGTLERDADVGDSFDMLLVADVAALVADTFDSVAELVEKALAALTPRGVLLLAAANPDVAAPALDGAGTIAYLDLHEAVATHFDHVTMLGQAPFAACTVADFSAGGEPAVTIDSSLMAATEQPSHYLALASQHPVSVDPYMVLQVPMAALASWQDVSAGGAAAAGNAEALRIEVAELKIELSLNRAEADQQRQKLSQANRDARENRQARAKLAARTAELEQQLERTRADAKRARAGSERVARLEAQLVTQQREAEQRREDDRDSAQEELDRMLDRIAELEVDLHQLQEDRRIAERSDAAEADAAAQPCLLRGRQRRSGVPGDPRPSPRRASQEEGRDQRARNLFLRSRVCSWTPRPYTFLKALVESFPKLPW